MGGWDQLRRHLSFVGERLVASLGRAGMDPSTLDAWAQRCERCLSGRPVVEQDPVESVAADYGAPVDDITEALHAIWPQKIATSTGLPGLLPRSRAGVRSVAGVARAADHVAPPMDASDGGRVGRRFDFSSAVGARAARGRPQSLKCRRREGWTRAPVGGHHALMGDGRSMVATPCDEERTIRRTR